MGITQSYCDVKLLGCPTSSPAVSSHTAHADNSLPFAIKQRVVFLPKPPALAVALQFGRLLVSCDYTGSGARIFALVFTAAAVSKSWRLESHERNGQHVDLQDNRTMTDSIRRVALRAVYSLESAHASKLLFAARVTIELVSRANGEALYLSAKAFSKLLHVTKQNGWEPERSPQEWPEAILDKEIFLSYVDC